MKQLLDKYKTLSDQRQYHKIIAANIVNRFGDAIDQIAFTWLEYELTHSALWSTLVFGVNMLPTVLIQPFAGAIVERMRKQNVMVVCDIIRGILVAGIAFGYVFGILQPWILLAVTFLNSLVEAMRVPAGIAIVPRLLDKQCFDTGVSLNSSCSRAMELIGTGAAGFIIALIGVHGAILLDALTFFMSAGIIALIRYQEETKHAQLNVHSYFVTLKEGFHYIMKSDTLLVICVIGAFLNFFTTPLNSVLPSYIHEVLRSGSEMLSVLSIAISLGSILGSFLYPLIAEKISKRWLLIGIFLFEAIFFILIIVLPYVLPSLLLSQFFVLVLFFVIGFLSAACSTYLSVYLTSHVDVDYMARISATFSACLCCCIPIASVIISLLLNITSFVVIMLGTGVLSLVVALCMLPLRSICVLDEK